MNTWKRHRANYKSTDIKKEDKKEKYLPKMLRRRGGKGEPQIRLREANWKRRRH
jgi:hypothetical protein